jgi:hypothetical protein
MVSFFPDVELLLCHDTVEHYHLPIIVGHIGHELLFKGRYSVFNGHLCFPSSELICFLQKNTSIVAVSWFSVIGQVSLLKLWTVAYRESPNRQRI